jgi:predicted nucleic-acid-binding Zn-ribbon protein
MIIKLCDKCNSNAEPKHIWEDGILFIWIECRQCGNTSLHSYQTLIEAIKDWNNIN